MRYAEHRVRPSLASRVECIWIAQDAAAGPGPPERVLPDGCIEWIFHLGAPYARVSADGAARLQPRSFVVGEMIRPIAITPTGLVHTLGVRFRPGGARDVFAMPLDFLTDGAAATPDLWGAGGRRIEDEVGNARRDAARREVIERFLETRVDRARATHPRLDAAVALVLRGRGRVPVGRIARGVGWSPRQLEREFRAGVGLSPKALSRIARFQNVLRLAGRHPAASWADLAARCGYADQAHLVREFRELSGTTPASGEAAGGELTRHFVEPARLDELLSPGRDDVAFVQDVGKRPS